MSCKIRQCWNLKYKALFKSPIFLATILVSSTLSGLVFGVPCLKERWGPRIEYLDDYQPVDPEKTEFVFGGGGYLNERWECHRLIYTSWSAKRFRVVIESFPEQLQVLDGNETVEFAPYVLQEGNLPEERCIWLGFTVVMPNQTGTYEVDLSITLYGWLFSKEYEWRYELAAEAFAHKTSLEECFSLTTNKETYRQDDIMTITIENISNETIWFTDGAYNIFFERFTGVDWEFHTAPVAIAVMTPLEAGETAQLTWPLDAPGQEFPAGRYRVGTHGVYAEFEVLEAEVEQAELERIIIEFLKTTDVADSLRENTVEILEVYDHKLGGKVVVVNYTTINAVHPYFMCEAIEHHTAVITLDEKLEVVSAFCVWGSFHNGKIWDLVNERWINGM